MQKRIEIRGLRLLCALGAGLFFGKCGLEAQAVIPTEKQVEADWQDDRWNSMESDRFQAAVVPLPSGNVHKGFAVAVGPNREATLCYDTEHLVLRGLWSGGLFEYSGRRYGVVQSPRPLGEPVVLTDGKSSLLQEGHRWEGFVLNGERLILAFQLGQRVVYESPWWEAFEGSGMILRELTITPGEERVALPLAFGKATVKMHRQGGEWQETAAVVQGDETLWVSVVGGGGRLQLVSGEDEQQQLYLEVASSTEPRSLRVMMLRGQADDEAAFDSARAKAQQPRDVRQLRQAGPKQWAALKTSGDVSRRRDAYVLDTLTVPYENPWQALLFLTGVDFFSNGDAAVCTMHGDVWLVSGIDESLQELTWHRYATGLFQPLGLQVINDVVHVLGRDQITVLEDLNADGHADVYRNFSNLIHTQPGHRFVTSLEADAEGNCYYVDPNGLHRISADGERHETLATGWRNPNGMGLSPDGVLTVAPQQGGWTPSSLISEASVGGFYGSGGPKVSETRPLGYDPQLCWLPHAVDNSGASQVWAAAQGWGPLSGRMIHLSYGRCSMMLVFRDRVNGVPQGGVVPLKGRFLSGAMRGAVNPVDGQLYVVGARGWQTSALRDGSFQRVRFTGRPLGAAVDLRAHRNGLVIEFSEALEPEWAEDPGSYGITQWNYRYSKEYGSPDYSVKDPDQEGRDEVAVSSARLLADQRTVFLTISDVQPVMQMEVRYNLRSLEGGRVRGAVYHTINALRPAFAE